jgi:hypothetical protein
MTTYTWGNPFQGNYDSAFNWSPFGVPTASDTAEVLGSLSTKLNITHDDSAFNFFLENPNAQVNDSGGPAYLRVGNEYFQNSGHFNAINQGYLNFNSGSVAYLYGGSMFVSSSGRINNSGVVYQDGTQVTMGFGGGINNGSGAYWDILNNSGIGQTGSSVINNYGVFEKTGGGGTSRISGRFNNYGNVYVGIGKLEFKFVVDGGGQASLFNQGSQLQYDRFVDGVINFNDLFETVTTRDAFDFDAVVNNFAHTDAIRLLGNWHETNYFYDSGNNRTHFDVASGATTHDVVFAGYVPGLSIHSGSTSTITHA